MINSMICSIYHIRNVHKWALKIVLVNTYTAISLPLNKLLPIINVYLYYNAGRPVQNQLLKPQLTIYQRLANMIMNGGNGSREIEAVGKVFNLYRSCMDEAAIERLGAAPLLNLIRDSLGTSHARIHECMYL